ncbi:MAG: hypothetical protein AAFZ92_08880, partial [Pseudomonadota bacterium]
LSYMSPEEATKILIKMGIEKIKKILETMYILGENDHIDRIYTLLRRIFPSIVALDPTIAGDILSAFAGTNDDTAGAIAAYFVTTLTANQAARVFAEMPARDVAFILEFRIIPDAHRTDILKAMPPYKAFPILLFMRKDFAESIAGQTSPTIASALELFYTISDVFYSADYTNEEVYTSLAVAASVEIYDPILSNPHYSLDEIAALLTVLPPSRSTEIFVYMLDQGDLIRSRAEIIDTFSRMSRTARAEILDKMDTAHSAILTGG